MRQEVNLYLAEYPVRQRKKISKKLALFVAFVMLVVTGGGSFSYWKLQQLKNELVVELNSTEMAKTAMDKLQKVINKSASDDTFKVKLIELKDELSHKESIRTQLKEILAVGGNGFSEQFIALARQDIRGLWITEVELYRSEKKLVIHGETQKPELIMVFLKRLNVESAFRGTKFSDFKVDPADQFGMEGPLVSFAISTQEFIEESTLDKFLNANTQKLLKNE